MTHGHVIAAVKTRKPQKIRNSRRSTTNRDTNGMAEFGVDGDNVVPAKRSVADKSSASRLAIPGIPGLRA